MKTKPIQAWHFVGNTLRDGRPVPADGVKLTHPGVPVLCSSGLHASVYPFDALPYAPGATLCLVECGGTILHQEDKLVCTERTILARMNAEPLLRECLLRLKFLDPLRHLLLKDLIGQIVMPRLPHDFTDVAGNAPHGYGLVVKFDPGMTGVYTVPPGGMPPPDRKSVV